MRLAFAFTCAIGAGLLLMPAVASAQSRLGAAADSLEDSLKALRKQFEHRGDRFEDAAGSLFRTIDRARDDSDRLAKEAGRNPPKWQIQSLYQNVRSRMTDLGREIGRFSGILSATSCSYGRASADGRCYTCEPLAWLRATGSRPSFAA